MTTMKWLAAAAIVTAIATPALAKDVNNDAARGAKTITKQDRKVIKQQRLGARQNIRRDDRMGYGDDEDAAPRGYVRADGFNNDGYWRSSNTGFWPGDVAADVVGGAITTAGAIATAPFRGYDNSYAYSTGEDNRFEDGDNWSYRNDRWTYRNEGFNNQPAYRAQARVVDGPPAYGGYAPAAPMQSYAQRNGFVCTPGSYFKAENGRLTLCQ